MLTGGPNSRLPSRRDNAGQVSGVTALSGTRLREVGGVRSAGKRVKGAWQPLAGRVVHMRQPRASQHVKRARAR